MSEARFTLGPWRLDHDPLGSGVFSDNEDYHGIEAGDGFISGGSGFNCTGFMSKYDATLIAASPELHAAVEALTKAIRESAPYKRGDLYMDDVLRIADAALSRARGE